MYALSRRRDLPLFSSLFRAKIRTRILSSPFECIRAPDRHPVNHMGRVNFQHLTKYSLRNFVSPTPCGIRRPLSLSHFPCVPLLPPPFRTGIGAAKALPSFLPRAFPAQCDGPLVRLSSVAPLAARLQPGTNENSPEFSQKRKLGGVQIKLCVEAKRQCKMKKKSSFIRSSGEIEGLSTPLLRASVRRI